MLLRIVVSIALLALFASAAVATQPDGNAASCVHLAALDTPASPARQPPAPEDASARSRARAPITEVEVLSLVRALEPAQQSKDEFRIKAMVEKSNLRMDRAQSILGDVAGLLATIHAKDALARLRSSRDVASKQLEWMETALGAIPGCVRGSFAGRGGEPAFAESLKIVEKHRVVLERALSPLTGKLPVDTGRAPR